MIKEIIPPIPNPESIGKEQLEQYKQRTPETLLVHGRYLVLSEEYKRAEQQQKELPEPKTDKDEKGNSNARKSNQPHDGNN